MNRILLISLVAVSAFAFAPAKRDPYRVVYDLTSRDTLEQKAVLRWIREVHESSPGAQMEVVMYSKGIELVMPERSAYIDQVKDAMKTANAKFVKVTLNDQVIHENAEAVKGATPGGLSGKGGKEAAMGPLFFQGDHEPVAFRNIRITPKK